MTNAATLSSQEIAILDAVADRASGMIDRVKAWSRINSGSRNADGLEAMRAELEEAYRELGAQTRAIALPDAELIEADGSLTQQAFTPSFEARMRPDAPVQIVMTGHHDTVFPKDFHFQDVTLWDEDTLNGPGVADMKGGLIVMLEALLALEQHPQCDQVGYTVLISPDEEIGSPGSRDAIMERGAKAHVGMTYEPALANGDLAGARKGSGNFTFRFKGRAAHAGREHHLGRNAIVAAARVAAALDDLNGQRDGVTVNVGKIDGGGPVNIVPDTAVLRFNTRLPDQGAMDWRVR